MYDAIVVGAGPGGATAAYFLGQAGLRVLVLERETLPRYKACGGGLSARMLESVFPFSFEPVIESRISAAAFVLGKRTTTVPMSRDAVHTVMRDRFDAHILSHARAEVRTGTAVRRIAEAGDRVRVETGKGETLEAQFLIGADGAASVVARDLGLRRGKTLAAAIEAEVRVAPEVQRRFADRLVFIFDTVRYGYAWIFPKAEHLSVGIAALRPWPGQLQAALARAMARHGISLEGVPLHGHPIPIYTGRQRIATARALLVGDAAGLADPFTGEGIRLAIKSGRLAARALLADRPEDYPAWVHGTIGLSHTFGLGLAALFYRFPRLCLGLGAANPFITQAFADMLADRADHPEVVARILASLPAHAITEVAAAWAGLVGGSEQRERLRAAVYGWR